MPLRFNQMRQFFEFPVLQRHYPKMLLGFWRLLLRSNPDLLQWHLLQLKQNLLWRQMLHRGPVPERSLLGSYLFVEKLKLSLGCAHSYSRITVPR